MSEFLKQIADFSPKRLLLLAAELEEQVRSLQQRPHAPIAIVGVGCRYPGGVRDTGTFWQLLTEGRDAITEVPRSRWNVDELYDPDPYAVGKVATRWGGFLESPELFDAPFFSIAPLEAEGMDPQQRLLLEVSWEALEDAAIDPSSLAGSRTGVYVGLCNSDYAQRTLLHTGRGVDAHFAQGASHAVAAGRISYFLGLRGPSIAVDTACSSSLVAVHQGCQSLRLRETDLVLAGGVNLVLSPEVTMALSRAQMMAPDGRCKAFSAEANGFVRGEGCGVVVLKRLDDALREGDRVLAVIRGSAVNQDGRSSGITAPNGPSQEDVIRAALADASLEPDSVGYVEAHGTGTNLGDRIELQALDSALGRGRAEDARLMIGSVKSNFGHAESAAGVAGLIKLVLSLQHRQIPASLHCSTLNPVVDWATNRLRVPVAVENWLPVQGHEVCIGGVSSFGFSGTNAHLIVAESPQTQESMSRLNETAATSDMRVIALSARSEDALHTIAAQLAGRLGEQPDLSLGDVAYTLGVGRADFSHRAAMRADSTPHLIEDLNQLAQGHPGGEHEFFEGVAESRAPRVAFLFAGQGGEHTGMGLSLLDKSDVFRTAVGEVDAALKGAISAPIETIFRNQHNELAESALVQPALYAFQYGLAKVWQSWGVKPHILVGHSMGEIVAATIAGVMSVEDASLLVAARGRLTGELGDRGGMVAVAASEDEVLKALAAYEADVSIAAINGPSSVVISGRSEPLESATQEFERAGVRVKRLNITYGSHSPAMHRVLPEFFKEASKVKFHAPVLPIIADLTGQKVVDASIFNAQYFTSHLARPVQFRRCLDSLEQEQCGLCIEMGPRAVLTTFGRERGGANTDNKTQWIASANGREADHEALQTALAEAFTSGAMIDWKSVFRESRRSKIALPTYPFERERYWIAVEDAAQALPDLAATGGVVPLAPSRRSSHPHREPANELLGVRVDSSVPIFEVELHSPLPLHLDQHRVGSQVVLPASVYLSLAWNAFEAIDASGKRPVVIRNLSIHRSIQPADESLLLQTALYPSASLDATSSGSSASSSFRISSRSAGPSQWTLHATGEILYHSSQPSLLGSFDFNPSAADWMSGDEFYRMLEDRGVHLGDAFRGIQELWHKAGTALGRIVAKDMSHTFAASIAGPHPALLDACFQMLGAAGLSEQDTRLRLMSNIDEMILHGPLPAIILVLANIRSGGEDDLEGSIELRSEEGNLLGSANGIRLRRAALEVGVTESGDGWLYEPSWIEAPLKERHPRPRSGTQWVILGEPAGLAGAVVGQLSAQGARASLVDEHDLASLVRDDAVKTEYVDLRAFDCDSLNLNQGPLPARNADGVSIDTVARTLASVTLWQRVVADSGKLWIFTQGAQLAPTAVNYSGIVQAPLWGLARCATLEHPNRLRRIVDLDASATRTDLQSIVVAELFSSDREEQVAYRGVKRLAFRLGRSRQTAAQWSHHEMSERETPTREDGSYLLTGGLGGLGLRIASWLSQRQVGKVVLITRSLTSIDSRRDELDAIRAAGADLEIVQADVSDEEAMRKLFARFGPDGDLPPLRGILHMAADVSSAPIEGIKPDQVRSIFKAKVKGTLVLHELTRDLALDFFVAFSSTSAVIGASHLGHYAAANSFLDAMASFRAGQGLPFVSISWGTWKTMRLATLENQHQYSSGGMLPMQDEAALQWLGDLMRSKQTRSVAVANIDWEMLAPLYESKRARSWLDDLRPRSDAPSSGITPSWNVEAGESRLASLERAVQKESARVLGYRDGKMPAMNARLADLGLDSLMAVNLRNRLQTLIGQGLSPTFAFEFPTPSEMALALDMLLWGSGAAEDESSTVERDEIRI